MIAGVGGIAMIKSLGPGHVLASDTQINRENKADLGVFLERVAEEGIEEYVVSDILHSRMMLVPRTPSDDGDILGCNSMDGVSHALYGNAEASAFCSRFSLDEMEGPLEPIWEGPLYVGEEVQRIMPANVYAFHVKGESLVIYGIYPYEFLPDEGYDHGMLAIAYEPDVPNRLTLAGQ